MTKRHTHRCRGCKTFLRAGAVLCARCDLAALATMAPRASVAPGAPRRAWWRPAPMGEGFTIAHAITLTAILALVLMGAR